MLKIYKPVEAMQSILKRVPLDDMDVSSKLLESIQAIFGAPLTPEGAVKRILQDIRIEGDEGLRRWSVKLDGLGTNNFRVPVHEIYSAKNMVSKEVLDALDTLVEAFIRNAWDAGFRAAMEQVDTRHDVPVDTLFEQYMTDLISRLED